MTNNTLASYDKCTGCMACVASCAKNALSCVIKDDGHYYVQCDESLCVKCGRCASVCPINLKYGVGSNDLNASKPFKGWSSYETYRKNGTSGGVFGAIAHKFIGDGGVVVGVALIGNDAKYIVVQSVDDIVKLQGSKYLCNDILSAYELIEKNLQENKKVLFSGLPCHAAGVMSYFKKHQFRNNLFVIDLVCGGVPSLLLKQRFLMLNPGAEIRSFRNKHQYVLTYDANGRCFSAGSRNLLISGFLSGLTARYSCYNCAFAKAHRMTDLTLGDYWQKEKELGSGVSLLLVHNSKGEKMVNGDFLEKKNVEWKDFLYSNPKIVLGGGWLQSIIRIERKHLAFFYKHLPLYIFNVIYASAVKKFDLLGYAFVAYKKLRTKLIKLEREKQVAKLLEGK